MSGAALKEAIAILSVLLVFLAESDSTLAVNTQQTGSRIGIGQVPDIARSKMPIWVCLHSLEED